MFVVVRDRSSTTVVTVRVVLVTTTRLSCQLIRPSKKHATKRNITVNNFTLAHGGFEIRSVRAASGGDVMRNEWTATDYQKRDCCRSRFLSSFRLALSPPTNQPTMGGMRQRICSPIDWCCLYTDNNNKSDTSSSQTHRAVQLGSVDSQSNRQRW